MPYARPTLTDLRGQVAQDIAANLPGADALLRFSNLNVLGTVQAGLAYLHYGYLDYIAQNSVPFTATGEFLEGWAALKGVLREAPTSASGAVTFTGTTGTVPAGWPLVRGDGVKFTTTETVAISGGNVVVPATANGDPAGLTGAFGNTDIGVGMTLAAPISGINSNGLVSTAFVGGADLETDDALRARMLAVYQQPPQGGAIADYLDWALAVPGVTRAWVQPSGFGVGTVVVYTMFDSAESAHAGFPQGSNGVAAAETRGTAATGDLLAVVNAIFPVQPVTALVYAVAPVASPKAFSISGVPLALRAQVAPAIADVFLRLGTATGGSVPLDDIWSAISSIGANDFLITSPTGDITTALGYLPTVGTITFS